MVLVCLILYTKTIRFCRKDPHADEIITLSLSSPALELGTPPRLCYPLVIFLLRVDSEENIHPDETVRLLISY